MDTLTGWISGLGLGFSPAPTPIPEPTPVPTPEPAPSDEEKVLVAYFPATNTTNPLAEYIANGLDADIYECGAEQSQCPPCHRLQREQYGAVRHCVRRLLMGLKE